MNRRLQSLPILVLSVALQLLPLCRQLFVAPASFGSPLAIIFRWAAGTAALLGANHALSGATSTMINSSNTANATVGKKFNYTITTSGYQAFSWSASGLPTGIALSVNRLTNSTANVSTPVGTYQITLVAYEGFSQDGGATAPFLLTLSVGNAPTITTQPANLTNVQGSSASFSVAVTGTGPFTYQWSKDGGPIVGATNSNLDLANVQTDDAGAYRVAVSTLFGTTNSLISRGNLTVLTPPSIDLDPFDVTISPGNDTSLSVAASGSAPLKFQWRFNGTNVVAGTNSLLTLKSVQASKAGPYFCVVTNAAGSATSAVATVTLLGMPVITSQPQSFTAVEGDATALSVAVNTTPLGYQWYFKNALLPGETDSSIFLNPIATNQAGPYFVVVSNSFGSVTSDVATVNVLVPPTISAPIPSQTVFSGGTANFLASARGTETLSYQWQFQGVDLPGRTLPALTLPSVNSNNAGAYRVIVTNIVGSVTSAPVALNVVGRSLLRVLGQTSSAVQVGFLAEPGVAYDLLCFNSVADTNLIVLTNWPPQPNATNATFTDAVTNGTLRFYQLRMTIQ